MERVLILSADKWRLTDEKTGEIRQGVSVQYVTDYREESEHSAGFKALKVPASDEVFASIKSGSAPGLYDVEMRTRPGKEGQTTVMAVKATLVRKVGLFDQPATIQDKIRAAGAAAA